MPRHGRFTHGEVTWYSLYKRMDGPRDLSEWVRKISSLAELDRRAGRPFQLAMHYSTQ